MYIQFPGRITPEQAEKLGFEVDISANLAYKGERLDPTESVDVFTGLEALLLDALTDLVLASNCAPEHEESAVQARALIERLRVERKRFYDSYTDYLKGLLRCDKYTGLI